MSNTRDNHGLKVNLRMAPGMPYACKCGRQWIFARQAVAHLRKIRDQESKAVKNA